MNNLPGGLPRKVVSSKQPATSSPAASLAAPASATTAGRKVGFLTDEQKNSLQRIPKAHIREAFESGPPPLSGTSTPGKPPMIIIPGKTKRQPKAPGSAANPNNKTDQTPNLNSTNKPRSFSTATGKNLTVETNAGIATPPAKETGKPINQSRVASAPEATEPPILSPSRSEPGLSVLAKESRRPPATTELPAATESKTAISPPKGTSVLTLVNERSVTSGGVPIGNKESAKAGASDNSRIIIISAVVAVVAALILLPQLFKKS